jgi:hypothetical protein
VTKLYASGSGLHSLEGLRAFTALRWLYLDRNQLAEEELLRLPGAVICCLVGFRLLSSGVNRDDPTGQQQRPFNPLLVGKLVQGSTGKAVRAAMCMPCPTLD